MPRLKLVAVDGDLLAVALSIVRKYRLDPRDSIHAASAMSEGADTVVSTDRHFDRVKEFRRKNISDALPRPRSQA
jgi:predicted nucleic acid-binding protein